MGLQSAKGRSMTLLAKLNWRFHTKKNAPWVKVLKFKYCTRQRINSRNEAKLPMSLVWKGMKRGEEVFNKGVKWMPGHESCLNFWSNCWSNSGPIRSHIQGLLPQESINLQVKDVLSPSGWDWPNIPFELPPKVKADIQAVPIPLVARCSDKLAWKFSPKGDFDLRSAYCLATNSSSNDSFSGSWIWKLPSLPRIQIFIWKCMKQSIGVKECLANKGIPLDTTCPLCHLEAESIMHALQDCNLVKPTWFQLGTHCLYPFFFYQDIREWLTANCRLKSSQNAMGIPWNVLFSFII